MHDDPGLDDGTIAACLEAHYGVLVASLTFLPIGFDLYAAVYHDVVADETAAFLKVRFGPVYEPGLLVP